MTITSIIIRLVFTILLIKDHWRSLGQGFLYKMSRLQHDSETGGPFYSCLFDYDVNCTWFVNHSEISTEKSWYMWKNGNGNNTKDCSIQGILRHAKPLNINNSKHKVTCRGTFTKRDPFKVELGESIDLYCEFINYEMCQWNREFRTVNIPTSGRYSYIGDHQCSIRIHDIQLVDVTGWSCVNADLNFEQWVLNAWYSLELQNSTTVSNTSVVITEERSNDSNSITESKLAASVLGSAGIILLAAIIIGVLWLIRKRSKRRVTDCDVRRGFIQLQPLAPSSTVPRSFVSFRTTTAEGHAEGTDGYVVPIPDIINSTICHGEYMEIAGNRDTSNTDNHLYDYVIINN